jgi:chemotaxis response regulator CheB
VKERSIRVLVANRPLLRHVAPSMLSKQTGIHLVGETDNEDDIPSLIAETRPDILLIALDDSHHTSRLFDQLLQKFPALGIIAVSPNTNLGIFYSASMEIHSASMEGSKEALLDIIRGKTKEKRTPGMKEAIALR